MDISNINTNTRIPPTKVNTRSGHAAAETESAPQPSTLVSLSDTSHTKLATGVLNGLAPSPSSAAANEPTFDANKVEQIKAALRDGQFEVNPAKVADGLLDTVRNLLGQGAG